MKHTLLLLTAVLLTGSQLSSFTSIASAAEAPALPNAEQREAMLRSVAGEMERLDGEALWVRSKNRNVEFSAMVGKLAGDAREAGSWDDLMRAFARLDGSYPNLHARFQPADWYKRGRSRAEYEFTGEWLANGTTQFRLRNGSQFMTDDSPRPGDLLVAINGIPMEKWSNENLELCKFPLREQCDLELYRNFRSECFSWRREEPLTYTLEREGRQWQVPVNVNVTTTGPGEEIRCGSDKNLYRGFTLAHEGRFACLFTKNSDPSTVIFRISSFQYARATDKHPIDSVQKEVDALWPWWKKNAKNIRELTIDLANNGGGNEPIPYYEILFDRPFQEQWVRLKKLPEFANETLRKNTIFWGTPQQEVWYQQLLKDGTWDSIPFGSFLPPVPMFCAGDEKSNCRDGLFSVRDHDFRGRVTLLLNHWCVSSCDGFAYAVKAQLGSRVTVAGQPQSADTAYTRVSILLHLDPASPRGFRTEIAQLRGELKPSVLLSQTVSVGRSTWENGEEVSGIPLTVDRFVPWTFELGETSWRAYAVQALGL